MGEFATAQTAYESLDDKFRHAGDSKFFIHNPDYLPFLEGFEYVTQFLLDRPAMFVSDTQNVLGLLGFLDKEWYEAEHAKDYENLKAYFAELGDTMFFGLVAGVMHWEVMNDEQREFVRRAIDWSIEQAKGSGLDLNNAMQYVAQVKDPINYRSIFYQLIGDESVKQVSSRVKEIGKLHRKIRGKLNGEWVESDDLLHSLAHHVYENGDSAIESIQIQALFALAGLDINVHAH